jgi:CheY-like chemotaxis protein
VSVVDNGSGMTPEVAAHAVEPFYTTKPVGKGTGLGLSQVYGLIQQSDGDMQIDSAVGRGTTINIYLPALPEAVASVTEKKPTIDKEKALVVDDQPDVLSMAVELFRYMGYEVFSANNGEDALDILKRTPDIDVLFTDVVMPGMSGIELSERSREIAPQIKILLTSGYPNPALQGREWTPEYPFLSKPYRLPEIMKALRTAG